MVKRCSSQSSTQLKMDTGRPVVPPAKSRQQLIRKPESGFHRLPPEIHVLISQQLIYPDALSLKHTCRYFYCLVDTGIRLKVDWLMERRSLHLECPNDRRCDLGSDLKFCRGSVRLLMQRRREHMECESRPGLGCLVYGTAVCTHRRELSRRWGNWLRSQLTIEVWWILLGFMPMLLGWLWMLDLAYWGRVTVQPID